MKEDRWADNTQANKVVITGMPWATLGERKRPQTTDQDNTWVENEGPSNKTPRWWKCTKDKNSNFEILTLTSII